MVQKVLRQRRIRLWRKGLKFTFLFVISFLLQSLEIVAVENPTNYQGLYTKDIGIIYTEKFVGVRTGAGKEFKVIDTLFNEDFVMCDTVIENGWVKIYAWKGREIGGYVQNSNVLLVEKLSTQKQQLLLSTIISKQRDLAKNFHAAFENRDSLSYVKTRQELEYYSDVKYSPALEILAPYFCKSADTYILRLFYEAMIANKGSANEQPAFVAGQCFSCHPEKMLRQIDTINSCWEKSLIFDNIEWGLQNMYSVEEGISNNKEYLDLKTKLDESRKNACP